MPGLLSAMLKDARAIGGSSHRILGKLATPAGRTAIYGGAAGAMYGAMSSDTSILGGATMGAGLALGGRYARSSAKMAGRYMSGGGPTSWGGLGLNMRMGAQNRIMKDVHAAGSKLRSNATVSRVASTLKNWRSSMRM